MEMNATADRDRFGLGGLGTETELELGRESRLAGSPGFACCD